MKEIEHKLYAFAVGFVGLAVVVLFYRNVWPIVPVSVVRELLHSGVGVKVLATSEAIFVQALGVVAALPLLKATRYHLSVADIILVSLPSAYMASLSLCDGFEPWLLLPIAIIPLLYTVTFKILTLRFIPSIVDDYPQKASPILLLGMSFIFCFQFAVLISFLSGATSPFKVKLSYIIFFVGASIALAARLRPHFLLVLAAIVAFIFNAEIFLEVIPTMAPYMRCL